MKKASLFILSMILIVVLCGCQNTDYKSEETYKIYISDSKKGYDDIPYYNVKDSLYTDAGKGYYINNSRRVGDYLITDYEDGVCINRCYKTVDNDGTIEIPKEIDGKPVVKLGGFLDEDDRHFVLGAFVGNTDLTIKIPSTVKVITSDAVLVRTDMIPENYRSKSLLDLSFIVDKSNPYYSSVNGSLLSKDGKKLLWLNRSDDNYTVPDSVEVFEPSNGVSDLFGSITIGKNVKKINTSIDFGESGRGPKDGLKAEVIVKGYKNTAAEKWAKEQNVTFIAIKK